MKVSTDAVAFRKSPSFLFGSMRVFARTFLVV